MACQSTNEDAGDNHSDNDTIPAEPYVIKENVEYGRHVVAATDIPKASSILDEVPVMCAPWPIDDKVSFEEPLCLGCCMHMPSPGRNGSDSSAVNDDALRLTNRCSKCNWPVCSTTCEELSLHKDNECQLFQEAKLPYPPPGDNMNIVTTSVMIQLIRCLLIKRDNDALWTESILNLQSRTALGTQPWNFNLLLDDIKVIFPILETELGDRPECCKILSIININAFSNTFSQNAEFSGCAICLFLQASMIAHSCSPNCWWTLTEDPGHRIVIKSCDDIKDGDLITVCYSNQYSVFGTLKRQEMFRSVGGFVCKCRRCCDPQELGSFVSGVICEKCMRGYKLPLCPLEEVSRWRCEQCGHIESQELVDGLVKALENRMNACSGNVPLLVRFLENSKSVLHNNHWIVTQTEDAIMKEWAHDPDLRYRGTCALDVMMTCEYFISLCFHVLSVRNITSPGLSFHRVRYLLFFARARLARLEFLISILEDHKVGSVSSSAEDGTKSIDTEIQNLRQEYQEILQFYHEVIEYRHMSSASDIEIKGEIEHMMKLMKPIVQMEPHHKFIEAGSPSSGSNCDSHVEGGCTLS